MNIPISKFSRVFFVESQFRLNLSLLLIFFFIIILESKVLQWQEKQLAKITAEKTLVMRIEEMERIIQENAVKTQLTTNQPHVQVADVKYNLTGTSIINGAPCAIIDGLIYTEGNTIGDYTVLKITKDSVILENKPANKIKTLSLSDKDHF